MTKMSNDIGISRQSLSAIANNSVSMISLETIDKISDYLNVSPRQLISDDKDSALVTAKLRDANINNNEITFNIDLNVKNGNLNNTDPIYLKLNKFGHKSFYIDIGFGLPAGNNIIYKAENRTTEILNKTASLTPYSNFMFIQSLINECIEYLDLKGYKNTYLKEAIDYSKTFDEEIEFIINSYQFNYWSFMINGICTKDNRLLYSLSNSSLLLTPNNDRDSIQYDIIQ